MDNKSALDRDPRVQQLDDEVAQLVEKVDRLKVELHQAEEELRQRRIEDMEARRTVVASEPIPDNQNT